MRRAFALDVLTGVLLGTLVASVFTDVPSWFLLTVASIAFAAFVAITLWEGD